jgi:hypothetical protein
MDEELAARAWAKKLARKKNGDGVTDRRGVSRLPRQVAQSVGARRSGPGFISPHCWNVRPARRVADLPAVLAPPISSPVFDLKLLPAVGAEVTANPLRHRPRILSQDGTAIQLSADGSPGPRCGNVPRAKKGTFRQTLTAQHAFGQSGSIGGRYRSTLNRAASKQPIRARAARFELHVVRSAANRTGAAPQHRVQRNPREPAVLRRGMFLHSSILPEVPRSPGPVFRSDA